MAEFLPLLEGTPIAEDAIWAMLSECAKRKDSACVRILGTLSAAQEAVLCWQPGR